MIDRQSINIIAISACHYSHASIVVAGKPFLLSTYAFLREKERIVFSSGIMSHGSQRYGIVFSGIPHGERLSGSGRGPSTDLLEFLVRPLLKVGEGF
jgi:hypothetical protein